MAQKQVNIPGIGQVAFPDEMSDDDIAGVIQKQHPELAPSGPPPDARTSWQVAADQLKAVNQGITSAVTGIPGFLTQAQGALFHPIDKGPAFLKSAADSISDPLTTIGRGIGALATQQSVSNPLTGPIGGKQVNAPTQQQWEGAAQLPGNMLGGAALDGLTGAAIRGLKAKASAIPPHIALQSKLDGIVSKLSDPELHGTSMSRAKLGSIIESAKQEYQTSGHELADSIQQPARDAAAVAQPPTRRVTTVDGISSKGTKLDVIANNSAEEIRSAQQRLDDLASENGGEVEDADKTETIPNAAQGRVTNTVDTPPRAPNFLHDNIPAVTSREAGERLQRALATNQPPGSPSSAATDNPNYYTKKWPDGHTTLEQQTGSGPVKEDIIQTLRRTGQGELADAYEHGQKIHDQIDNDADVHLIQGMLDKNPDTAYTVLTQPNISEAQLSGIRKVVGPDVMSAMTAQVTRDLLANTWDKAVSVNPDMMGVQAGGRSLLDQLQTTKNGYALGDRLKSLMGPDLYQKLEDTARIAATKQVPMSIVLSNIGDLVSKHIPGAPKGIGTAINATARLMNSVEGGNYIREYVRALGNSDTKRIAFYGGRIQDYADRKFNSAPTQQEKPVEKASPMPPPPPG